MEYDFAKIEKKWQEKWEETQLYKTVEDPLKKFYLLVMFAYPSGDIHMGHFRNYSVADVYGRMKMMEGYQLLFPFGWDAFGLPAEGAAIKAKISPKDWTLKNISVSKNTLKLLGIAFDWSREVATCLPEYYKWTQWCFLQFYKKGLAYRKKALANWCPTCKTILANEQVSDGTCWRCHKPVDKKEMVQWFLKITDYSQRLLDGLDTLPEWPENIKTMQRNWIGRSEGLELDFKLEDSDEKLTVFTTRPDTLHGVTFVAIAPEHELAEKLTKSTEYEAAAKDYIQKSRLKKDIDRLSTIGEKDGVFTGKYAINPLSGERVQIWIGDYVLVSYGTGAVMGVPAHDERDFQFSKRYDIPLKEVIHPAEGEHDFTKSAYTESGIMVNSGKFSGMESKAGIKAVSDEAEKIGIGRKTINYRLRDWLISRQRYWGAPIPIVHCEKCGDVPVPESELPVKLPEGDIELIPKGRSPLEDCTEFINTTCPKCGEPAKRDADTMDTFICSSWYYLRYTDPHNSEKPFDIEKCAKWSPVDLYIGGAEHACMHLIYFRFFHKFLKDQGYLKNEEPVVKLFNHGMVLDEHGDVMSKSLGNVVSPINLIKEHGVDATRLAMFFATTSEKEVLWSDKFIVGVKRFLQKFIQLYYDQDRSIFQDHKIEFASLGDEEKKLYIKVQKMIAKVGSDIEKFQFNTAISALMEFTNAAAEFKGDKKLLAYALQVAIQLIAPMAPHIAEELWEYTGHTGSIFRSSWPKADLSVLKHDMVTVVVQVNGKLKERLSMAADTAEEELKATALSLESIKKLTDGKEIRKIITVKNKLINIVI